MLQSNQTPDEVIENADLLDLSKLENTLLEDPNFPVNFKNQVEDLIFEYKHFLAIKVVYNDTRCPMSSSPSDIIHQVWRLHCLDPANYLKCCLQLGVQIIEHDPAMSKHSLQEKQKRLDMTKSRYKILFPKLSMPHMFWEDFCQDVPTVEKETQAFSGIDVKVEPTFRIKKEPISNSEYEPPVDLPRIKTEPGIANLMLPASSEGVVPPLKQTNKPTITVRSDLELKENEPKKMTERNRILVVDTGGHFVQMNPLYQENDKDKEKMAENEINPAAVTDEHSVQAISNFASFDLNPILQENLKMCGLIAPTPIQKSCLPVVMVGKDVMACSHTGSGKTAAYLVPIVHKLMESGAVGKGAPQCLIITPTRELTLQIKEEAIKLSVGTLIQTSAIYGGLWPSEEICSKEQVNGYDILIATPGRFLQFVDKGWIIVENLKFIVMDDANKLLSLDKNIPRKIEDILKKGSKDNRQTLLFSRTFTDENLRSGGELLNNYELVTSCETAHVCSIAPQAHYEISGSNKRDQLKFILRKCNINEKILIFVRTKKEAISLAIDISSEGFPTEFLHGDLGPKAAELALLAFCSGRARILVSTAMINGLDINGVTLVINYDMPENVDDYIYRIGIVVHRASQNKPGKAINLIDRYKDSAVAPDIVKIITDCGQVVPDWLSRAFGKPQAHKMQQVEESEDASASKRKLTDKDENDNTWIKKKKNDTESTVKEIPSSHTKEIAVEEKLGKGEKEIKRNSVESGREDRKEKHYDHKEKESIPRATDQELKRNGIYVEHEGRSPGDRNPKRNYFNLPPSKENDCFYFVYNYGCYGDANCPYRHEPRARNSETMCKYWKNGNCRKPGCRFRHYDKEMMNKCRWESERGECPDSRCKFRHVN